MDPRLHTSIELLDLLWVHLRDPRKPLFTVSDGYVAKQLGITRESISNIRKGRTGFNDQNAIRVAELLLMDPAYVVACCHLERAKRLPQNDRVLELWERIAKSVAICLLGLTIYAGGVAHPVQAGTTEPMYTLCAPKGRRRSRLLGWFKGLLGPFLGVVLAGCASFPPDTYSQTAQVRVQALQARFNTLAGTDYPVPTIRYFDAPCDTAGETEAETVASVSWHKGALKISHVNMDTILVNARCAQLDPADFLAVTLPHELAHLDADRYYGGDQDHNGLWQELALKLGDTCQDEDITDASLRAEYCPGPR